MKNNENKLITKLAYNDIAQKYYNEYHAGESDLIYFDEFLANSGKKILDLGCGMGHYSGYISRKGYEVVGIDFSEGMLNIARKTNPNIKFINSDVCNLPSDLANDFDGIVLAFVLQHLSKDEAKECLSQAHEHLKYGGKLLVLFRAGNKELVEKEPFNPTFIYKIKEYSDGEIIGMLSECGFETVKLIEKPYYYDPNSVSPITKVLFAKNIQKDIGCNCK